MVHSLIREKLTVFFSFSDEIITCQPAYAISNQLREKEPVGYVFLYLNVAVLFSILEK